MHTSAQYLVADDKRTKVLATIADYLPEPAMMSIIFREARIDRHRALVIVASRKYEETGKPDVVPACSDVDPSMADFIPIAGVFDYYMNKKWGSVRCKEQLLIALHSLTCNYPVIPVV